MAQEYLLVDGYNIIFAWDTLKEMAQSSLEDARVRLMDMLCDYQGFKQCQVILVFDAGKVKNNLEHVYTYHNITVVYTKEAETADNYIERTVGHLAKDDGKVYVASSDYLEQIIILGKGAYRLSAGDLFNQLEQVKEVVGKKYMGQRELKQNLLVNHLDPETARKLENMRRGKGS